MMIFRFDGGKHNDQRLLPRLRSGARPDPGLGLVRPLWCMGQRLDVLLRVGDIMKIMQNDLPAPVTQRLDWLEADNAAQRTAILKLEREVKRLINGGTVLAALVGLLLGRVFL